MQNAATQAMMTQTKILKIRLSLKRKELMIESAQKTTRFQIRVYLTLETTWARK